MNLQNCFYHWVFSHRVFCIELGNPKELYDTVDLKHETDISVSLSSVRLILFVFI
jgi:hypothetical protein